MRNAALASTALFFCGCVSLAPAPKPTVDALPLLSPATLGFSRSVQQVLHVAYGEQDATLSAVLTVTPERLQVIGLNAVGLRLFTLDYDGAALKTERAPGLPEQ